MNNLKDHFTAILEACKNCAEVCEKDDPISTGLGYEEKDLRIRLSFMASKSYDDDTGFLVKVEEISGEYISNDEEEDVPDSELSELAEYIEKELPSLLED